MATIASLAVKLGINPAQFQAGLAKAKTSLNRFVAEAEKSAARVEKLGAGLGKIGKPAAGIAVAAASAANLASILITTAGAAAILPGILTAGVGALAAFKVGVAGVSDALSAMDDPAKFAEATAKLAPSAREWATAVRDLGPAWKSVQLDVQQRLFTGLAQTTKTLAGAYLPTLRTGLGGVADAMNASAKASGKALMAPEAVGSVNAILGDTASVVKEVGSSLGDWLRGFLAVAKVGTSFLPGLVSGAGDAAKAFRTWAESAEGQQRLNQIISRGLSIIGDLALTVRNVGQIFRNVFAAAGADGAGLVATLQQLTATAAEWTASAEGQQQIADVWSLLSQVSGTLTTALQILGPALGTLAGWFASLPAPVQSVIGGFLGWSALLGPLLVKVSGLVTTLTQVGPKLLVAGQAVAGFTTKLATLGVRMATTSAGFIARVTVMATTAVAKFALMAAQATVHAARVGAAWLLTTGAQMATAAASMAATAARMVAQWALMAAGAMARAAVMAASWLVAMGPVGWVIAAIGALVALIIANWDTVKQWTSDAWRAVSDFVAQAWSWIVGKVQWGIDQAKSIISWFSQLPGLIAGWFGSAKDWALRKLQELLSWLAGLPGRILSAIGSLGSLLLGAGRDLVSGLWNGIVAMGSWLYNKILGWIKSVVPGPILSFLGISSPSKWGDRIVGRMIPAGIGEGIIANAAAATRPARQVAADTAAAALDGAHQIEIDPAWPAALTSMLAPRGGDGTTTPAASAADPAPQITLNIYNPIGEPTTVSVQRDMQLLSALGTFRR
ncbi:hypothetical protein ACFQE5_23110 [Pseudonocardia hispaniensis]|uniref:Phage-related protein n=1 Tax=Pseudonocardia hispaniensis TaxID=904933 RepID=A0ABW1J886_9PSEU